MIKISDAAKEKIKEDMKKNLGMYFRLMFQGFGWGGPKLGLALEKPNKDEKPVKTDGIELLVSDMVKNVADGSLVDYLDSVYGKKFIIHANYAC